MSGTGGHPVAFDGGQRSKPCRNISAGFAVDASEVAGEAESGRVRFARDLVMVALAIVSIAVLVYDEVAQPAGGRRLALLLIDGLIVIAFAVEFVERMRRAADRAGFVRKNWYELPGMVPMALGNAGFLRVFRLVRVFAVLARLMRVRRLANGFLARSNLLMTLFAAFLVIFTGGFLVWVYERDANPQMFGSIWDGLWFAVVTAATVGYGDKVPITTAGRIVASALMLGGIGLIGVLAATIGNALAGTGSVAPAERRVEERLAGLASLHAAGSLTDEEYRRAKNRVLGEP